MTTRMNEFGDVVGPGESGFSTGEPAMPKENQRPVRRPMTYEDFLFQEENTEEELDAMRNRFLRESGWAHSCAYPGGLWLWSKEVEGKTVAVPRDTALFLEKSIRALS